MEKRHHDSLTSRLEDAFVNGCSHVTWDELYLWYGMQRLSSRVYSDIEQRWQDISNDEHGRLMMINGRGGIFVFGESKAERVDSKNPLDTI